MSSQNEKALICDVEKELKSKGERGFSEIGAVEKFANLLLELVDKYKSLVDRTIEEHFECPVKESSNILMDYAPYEKTQAIYNHNKFISNENGCELIRIINYSGNTECAPIYTNVRIKRNKYETLLTIGYMFFKWKEIPLIKEFYFIGCSLFVKLYFRRCDAEVANEFVNEFRKFAKKQNLFKGEKIMFYHNGYIEFLEFPQLSWNDVILSTKIKDEFILNLITPLQNEDYCKNHKVPWRRGLLLGGAAGTGKTQVCRILCNELKDMTVIWATPKALNDEDDISMLFEAARYFAPTLIIIEDIDFIGRSRDFSQDPSLGELLTQLDGNDPNKGIFVIATTNRPEMLDSALANRPSRFDVLIKFELPDQMERIELIKLFTQGMEFNEELNSEKIAFAMRDMTGAQIKEAFVYAQLKALLGKRKINIEDVINRAKDYQVKNPSEAYKR